MFLHNTLMDEQMMLPFSGVDISVGYVSSSAHCIGLGACPRVVCVRTHGLVSVLLLFKERSYVVQLPFVFPRCFILHQAVMKRVAMILS